MPNINISVPVPPHTAGKTGGTPAPKAGKGASKGAVRQSAAAQHLGAQKTAKPPKMTGAQRQIHQQRTQPKAQGGGGKNVFNPAGALGPSELAQIERTSGNIGKAEEGRVHQAFAGPIAEVEGGSQRAQQAFQGYGNTQGQLLGGIAQQAEGGAKTAENRAAELALGTGRSVETAGQSQAALTGGYLSPEVKGQLNAEGQRAAGMGAAGVSLAAQSGQNETNFMQNLRAVAAQKVTEGQRQIGSTFAKQVGALRNKEGEALGKVLAANAARPSEMAQKAFTDRAAAQTLNLKTQVAGTKAREGAQRLGLTERGQNLTAAERAAARATTERGQNLATARNRESVSQRENASLRSAELNRIGKETAQLGTQDKARYDQAQIRYKAFLEHHGGKAPSSREGRTYMAKLSTAEQIARTVMAGKSKDPAAQAKAREELAKKGASGDVISAALNLAVYGRLGPADRASAISYGLTPDLRPQWFRTK